MKASISCSTWRFSVKLLHRFDFSAPAHLQCSIAGDVPTARALHRQDAGFTLVELAAGLGISQRMVAYCEHPEAMPPAHLLPGQSGSDSNFRSAPTIVTSGTPT